MSILREPWPWYVAGPALGIFVPLLLLVGNRLLGVSSSLRHTCAAVLPSAAEFFRYDWRASGAWNLAFVLGIALGGILAGTVLANPDPIAISAATRADIAALGVAETSGLAPAELFSWAALGSVRGVVLIVVGGFLVGFGTAWAGGCTSGHGLAGIADFQLPSLVALVSFFAGGLLATWALLPLVIGAAP